MTPTSTRSVVLIGGPNGAGKTRWAVRYLRPTLGTAVFVNADEIARGLSPLDPESVAIEAGRAMLQRLDALTNAGDSFAFEATCAGRGHARLLRKCREFGYQVMLIFLWLPSPEAALARVARRVSEGGHRIPDDVVVRRYWAGLRNMRHFYLPLADTTIIFDNSDGSGALIAESRFGEPVIVRDKPRWALIEEVTR